MRTRTYIATIAQAGGSLEVMLPSIFPPWGDEAWGIDNSFRGVLGEDNVLTFQLQFEEWFPDGLAGTFRAYGRGTATISPGGLSGFWDGYMLGTVANGDGRGTRSVTCTAPDQGVVFSR